MGIFFSHRVGGFDGMRQAAESRGVFVWRDAVSKDALFTGNVGPSLYAGTQGQPVKAWGLLARGRVRLLSHASPASCKPRASTKREYFRNLGRAFWQKLIVTIALARCRKTNRTMMSQRLVGTKTRHLPHRICGISQHTLNVPYVPEDVHALTPNC